jgi:uncharacterized membrane protein YqjE
MEQRQTLARADEAHDLPSLVERVAHDSASLLDQKLALLKIEIKEEVSAYVRGSVVMVAGGIIAVVGFALLNVAFAFAIAALFANADLSQPARYAVGFVITGLAYLIIGAIVVVITKNRLARLGLLPRRTINELEKDKDWLQKEL